ncbi:hypothetical protein BsWGS_15124 [Bradybaena similaris]
MAEWDWCTFLLLVIVAIIVIALLVGGTYAAMTYFRMVEKNHQQNKHPAYKPLDYPQSTPGYMSDSPPVGHTNPQLPHSSSALSYGQHPDNSSSSPPYMSPTGATDTRELAKVTADTFSQLTPEQQLQAVAQYWQMMYYQYMQQMMSAAAEEQRENQSRNEKL